MTTITELKNYTDADENVIEYDGAISDNISIIFRGKRNRVLVEKGFSTRSLTLSIDCNDSLCVIRKSTFRGFIRLGEGCEVHIGSGVTCTENAYISAAEYSNVVIGDDCMLASSVQIRADDAHPIFCVATGARLNMPSSIEVGKHVWLGARSTVLSGSIISEGSVVGFGSIVKGEFPNNCIITGVPARVVRKNIAWERPHLTLNEPFYKPDSNAIKKSVYWNFTKDQS